MRQVLRFIFSPHVDVQLFQQILQERLYFPIEMLWCLCQKSINCICQLISMPSLLFLDLPLCQYNVVLIAVAFKVSLEIRWCEANFVLFFQPCFGYSRFCEFPNKFWNQIVNFYKNLLEFQLALCKNYRLRRIKIYQYSVFSNSRKKKHSPLILLFLSFSQ